MRTAEERIQKAQEIAFTMDAELPVRVWVEGNGTMWGEFQGGDGHRQQLDELQMVKLLHRAAHGHRQIISV